METVPLAYLITIRCYGTWFHGDERGSMDRGKHHRYSAAKIAANKALANAEESQLKHPPFTLTDAQRALVEKAIREACAHRNFHLLAVNVCTNHVHSVVAASCRPETVMNAFKSYATRQLRRAGLLAAEIKPWSRHGSTPYLWTREQAARAVDYVVNGQEDKPFDP